MDIEKVLWLILAAIMLPAIGIGLSAMAGGQSRVSHRPQRKRAKKAHIRQGRV